MRPMLACRAKRGAAGGHDVSAGINRITAGTRLRENAVVCFVIKVAVGNLPERLL